MRAELWDQRTFRERVTEMLQRARVEKDVKTRVGLNSMIINRLGRGLFRAKI